MKHILLQIGYVSGWERIYEIKGTCCMYRHPCGKTFLSPVRRDLSMIIEKADSIGPDWMLLSLDEKEFLDIPLDHVIEAKRGYLEQIYASKVHFLENCEELGTSLYIRDWTAWVESQENIPTSEQDQKSKTEATTGSIQRTLQRR